MKNLAYSKGTLSTIEFQNSLHELDVWDGRELGFEVNSAQSIYLLNFTKLNPSWLRKTAKKFISSVLHTKTFSTSRVYINSLIKFGEFITKEFPEISPNVIDRSIILKFLNYLALTNLSNSSKSLILINVRTFLETVVQEEWLPLPKQRIIFNNDIPKVDPPTPNYIPESVMIQLINHLNTLPENHARTIQVLMETGRRVSEICTLPFDCLKEDDSGYPFLEINDKKTRKKYMIPISVKCTEAIKTQQIWLKRYGLDQFGYLFTSFRKQGFHITARYVNFILKKLAFDKNIIGQDGKTWDFHAHQFRHTIGTRMINSGVPQAIVQRYLGHETPEMTSRYAHIHDQTLKEAFDRFQGTFDITNNEMKSYKIHEGEWLKGNIMAQALPNGHCALPLAQNRCPHANACLNCTHFRTDETYLPQYEQQLTVTKKILETVKKNNWHRQTEINESVKNKLEAVICSLNGCENENCKG